jgi:hypothetical protein
MVFLPITQAFSMPLFEPIAIIFDDSEEIKVTTKILIENSPSIKIIKYKDKNTIFNALILIRSYSEIILIGHGSEVGILTQNGEILSWKNIGDWVNTMPNSNIYFLACDSKIAENFVGKPGLGFDGGIDGISSALYISALLKLADGSNFLDIIEISQLLYQRSIDLENRKVNPVLLSTESGYSVAFKKQYFYILGPCFFGWCPKLTEENILWINFENWIANDIIAAVTTIGGYYADRIALRIVAVIGTPNVMGVVLTAGWWGALILALIIFIATSLYWNMGSRVRADAKIGIGAQYMPSPVTWYKLDNEPDWVSFPYNPTASTYLLAAAFALLPENWRVVV